MDRILLVIPCFKERQRLPAFLNSLCAVLAESELQIEVLPVDDGSGTEEAQFLKDFVLKKCADHSFLRDPLLLQHNRGKGGAVYAGWELAANDGYDWLAFVDADGAVSASEVLRVFQFVAGTRHSSTTSFFAVRTGAENTKVERTALRRFTGRVFALLVRMLFHMPIPDTQCGFKIVPASWIRENRNHLIEERFCFDIELAYWLLHSGMTIETIPIDWKETPGSHLGFKQVLQMFGSVLVMRQRLR